MSRLTGPACSPPSASCSAALGAERRTALVVEDLHWADPGTLDLLTFLVRSLSPGTALVPPADATSCLPRDPALDWLAATAGFPASRW